MQMTNSTATHTQKRPIYTQKRPTNIQKRPVCNDTESMQMTNSTATHCNTHCNSLSRNHENDKKCCNTVPQTAIKTKHTATYTMQTMNMPKHGATKLKQWTWRIALQHSATATKHTTTYTMETMNMPKHGSTQSNSNQTHCNLHNGQQTPLQLTRWNQWTWTTALQHSASATKHTATYTMEPMNMTNSGATSATATKHTATYKREPMNMTYSAATQCNWNKTQETMNMTNSAATATKHTATYTMEPMNMTNSATTMPVVIHESVCVCVCVCVCGWVGFCAWDWVGMCVYLTEWLFVCAFVCACMYTYNTPLRDMERERKKERMERNCRGASYWVILGIETHNLEVFLWGFDMSN